MVWCCHSWDSRLVVAFIHYCEISGVVLIVVVGGVATWDEITKGVKKIKSGIMVIGVGKRMHAVDNARQEGGRGEGTPFDASSCTEIEEPVGTLESFCWSKAYSGFYAGLREVLWEIFFVCLIVCAEFDFAVFIEINSGPCHECPKRNFAGHSAVYREPVDPKNGVFHYAGDHSVWGFFTG